MGEQELVTELELRIDTLNDSLVRLDAEVDRLDRNLQHEMRRSAALAARVSTLELDARANEKTVDGIQVGLRPVTDEAPRKGPPPTASPAGEVPSWVPDEVDLALAWNKGGVGPRPVYDRERPNWSAVRRLIASRAPRPAPFGVPFDDDARPQAECASSPLHPVCVYCGWVGVTVGPEITHSMKNEVRAHADVCPENPRRALERRIAELEAQRPAPQPSVEEMAERIYDASVAFDGAPLKWSEVGESHKPYWLSLAKAALSALPASEATRTTEQGSKDALAGGMTGKDPKPRQHFDHAWEGTSTSSSYCSRCGRDARDGVEGPCIPKGNAADAASEATKPAPLPPVSRGGETPTLEECFEEAKKRGSRMASYEKDGIAAVRSLMLASRAPSPSPALAAIVEKADAMRDTFERVWRDYAAGPCDDIEAYDRARASLPKDGAR